MHTRSLPIYVNTVFYSLIFSVMAFSILQLGGCAVAAVSGIATGAAIVSDRRPAKTILKDQAIEVNAIHAFSQNKPLWKQSHISAVSYNNAVLLVGQTPNEELKYQAEDAVKDIPNVKKVYNELSIGAPISIATRAEDSWITTQIKTKMLDTKGLNPAKIKVITENSIVYLMGLTTIEEEILATEVARTVTGVEKVVQVFDHT